MVEAEVRTTVCPPAGVGILNDYLEQKSIFSLSGNYRREVSRAVNIPQKNEVQTFAGPVYDGTNSC